MLHPASLLIPLLILLPNLVFVRFPPTNPPARRTANLLLKASEAIGRLGVMVIPLFYSMRAERSYETISLIVMLAAILFYYWGWIEYLRSDRSYARLLAPMLGIPVPMAVFPCLYFLAASIVLHSILFFVFAAIFALGHIANSCRDYLLIGKS
ncbi:hypothetical protein ACFFT4_31295 [Cohnella cellulosilytica]|uniref:hypothetical protein n=1 Tax=Cohnella cellulosilytica TaxID=986710 RepID=UPI0035ECFE71